MIYRFLAFELQGFEFLGSRGQRFEGEGDVEQDGPILATSGWFLAKHRRGMEACNVQLSKPEVTLQANIA